MKATRRFLCAVLLVAAGLPAWAAVSRDDAASIARRETRGRVLAVESVETEGRAAWRVKVLTQRGEVRVIFIDVATGQTRY